MLENERVCPKARRRHGSPDWPGDERAGLWQSGPIMAIGKKALLKGLWNGIRRRYRGASTITT